MIKFRSSDHTYWHCHRRVPSVTELLHAAGLIDTTYYTEAGRDRGVWAHQIIEDDIRAGGIEIDIVDPELAGSLRAWRKFKADTNIDVLHSELVVWWPKSDPVYAGTLDLIVRWQNKLLSVIDIKTGGLMDWTRLQTAAYALGYTACHGEDVHSRYALRLMQHGNYALRKHSRGKRDEIEWMDLLDLFGCALR